MRLTLHDLDVAFRQLYGKTPNQKPLYFRFIPYLTDGESRVLFEKDVYLLASKNDVKPVDMGIVVESAYYVLTDIWFGDGWEESLVPFTHSGADRYDDPIFKTTVQFEPEIDPETGEEKFEPKTLQIIGEESVAKAKKKIQSKPSIMYGVLLVKAKQETWHTVKRLALLQLLRLVCTLSLSTCLTRLMQFKG